VDVVKGDSLLERGLCVAHWLLLLSLGSNAWHLSRFWFVAVVLPQRGVAFVWRQKADTQLTLGLAKFLSVAPIFRLTDRAA
jgi:hypothetical protein